ncbi:PRP38-assoc multi-domain protein [Pyrenophora tritici-repentis]|nr:PRP38-assoc multi-domain protein [Pyrenophora tritici-repentis]
MDEEREELDEEMMDDIDEAIEVAEEELGQGEGPEPKKLSKIQKACLEFCIALLNHRITRREYDSPLVCALAVLGVKEDGWKGPEQYPPILSAVIKIARFMVVQKGLEIRVANNQIKPLSIKISDHFLARVLGHGCFCSLLPLSIRA